ncbi:serine/threonine protein kinase [Penicillium sp. DV-2018c]|nr:serine/threonine protein kinase [Penicillium sp. DV-2018c]
MDIQRQFPGVHWVWGGGISFVYEVHPLIVVKIYEILSRHPPCPYLVQCFLYTTDGIFLEYMRGATPIGMIIIYLLTAFLDISLAYRKQFNKIRENETRVVANVEYMEPLPLRKSWMNDLAQGVAFLESLNLAHGDLRAENILLDRDRLKLSDFGYTVEFGTDFETCPCPYGRLLNSSESDQGIPGSPGFALGSLFYLINYGFEVYDDHCLTDDPYEHELKVKVLLQDMKFPKLDGDPLIDDIIDKCWHNQYRTLAELATHTERLLNEPVSEAEAPSQEAASTPGQCTASSEYLSSKQEFCRDLEKRGLLRLLTSGEPMELGFIMEHRHVVRNLSSPGN